MYFILRSLIALSVVAVLAATLTASVEAARKFDHSATTSTVLKNVGFLGYKSFLIGPSGRDEPGFAMEGMRIISPSTIFSRAQKFKSPLLPPELYLPLKRKLVPLENSVDSLTINVKGKPLTLSLGLEEALQKDLKDHIGYYGVSGLTNPATGFASAIHLKSATDEIVKQIDLLEGTNSPTAIERTDGFPVRKLVITPEPPTILLFLTGLLFIVLLRSERLKATAPT